MTINTIANDNYSILPITYRARWSKEKACEWYDRQPWLVGCNYIPRHASNQFEMWQQETFNPDQISEELSWISALGMNTVRVFLHDQLWSRDPEGFKTNIETFLQIADHYHIKVMPVLFDSCWNPDPKAGPQPEPKSGVHNAGWVQSPGLYALQNFAEYPRLKNYVQNMVQCFADDTRVIVIDIFNEPGNLNDASYRDPEVKLSYAEKLLLAAFEWARDAGATQPLTSGLWEGHWQGRIPDIQREMSDVISMHNYSSKEKFGETIAELTALERPIFCTEYMARAFGNTFKEIMPIAKKFRVALYNWGCVQGRTQTNLAWETWLGKENDLWFHEIFHPCGTPYQPEECDTIKAQLADNLSFEEAAKRADEARLVNISPLALTG